MPHKKYESRMLAQLQKRIAGLHSIDATLDLGAGITVKGLAQVAGQLQHSVGAYNTSLSDADANRLTIKDLEAKARDLHERCLAGVAARFGKNSVEYQKAGGKKKSERMRPGQLKKAKAARHSKKAGIPHTTVAADPAITITTAPAPRAATLTNGVTLHP